MTDKIEVIVQKKTVVAHEVVDLILTTTDGSTLPDAEPGAHVEIHLPAGIKHYSIHAHCRSTNTYSFGIGLSHPSKGGSEYIHHKLSQGDRLWISLPKNNFKLVDNATTYIFIAGGIGITPILSMVTWCEQNGKKWRLLYSVRERSRVAYASVIRDFQNADIHVDEEAGTFADLSSFIGEVGEGAHVYCCGPGPLMDAVQTVALKVLPSAQVHFELFSPPESVEHGQSNSFSIELASSGKIFEVPADSSILDVLEQNGYEVPYSCREGLCRTCETTVLEGEVDHRDYVLDDDERESNTVILPCVSRCLGKKLKLDI